MSRYQTGNGGEEESFCREPLVLIMQKDCWAPDMKGAVSITFGSAIMFILKSSQ